jgi:hypothetical protein
MVLYLCVLIVFSPRRESLMLILVMNPSQRWFCHIIYMMFLMLYVLHIYLVTLTSAPFARIESRFLDMLSLHRELKLIMAKVEAIHVWPIPKTLSQV